MNNEFLWSQRYRPTRVADTILPEALKASFQKFVDQKNVPNLLLCGGAGVGKTTVAKAMLDELGSDYIVINGSMNGNIDTLRNEILQFVSSVSLMGTGRKYVILDEADYLNANSTQPALRNFMEEFSKNAGFILTANFKNKIIEPLHSRCSVVEFKFTDKHIPSMAKQFMKRTLEILDREGVPYERPVVAEVIKKHMPDWRRVLNELQTYSATGAIDAGILANLAEVSLSELVGHMRAKDFTACRRWIGENKNADQTQVFRQFYTSASDLYTPASVVQLVLLIGKYQYQAAFSVDPEINLAAFVAEALIELDWR